VDRPANFFSEVVNRERFGVDESKPPPENWLAAASASVRQNVGGGIACDNFDVDEFAKAMASRRA
jgi:hypothetical protein